MEQNLEHCLQCPGKAYRKTFVPGSGATGSNIVIVGECPGKSEVGSKLPFTGDSGKLLWQTLSSIGFPGERDSFYISNAVKCLVPNSTVATVNHCCAGYLEKELAECTNKKLILALGAKAFKYLVPDEKKGIMENTGKKFKSEKFGVDILACLHPAKVLRTERDHPLFKESLSRLLDNLPTIPQVKFKVTEDTKDLENLAGKTVSLDLETTGLDYMEKRITHIGVYDGETAYIFRGEKLQEPRFVDALFKLTLVAHNGTFDAKFIASACGRIPTISHDTMLMAYCQNESFGSDEDGGYSLERLSVLYLGARPWKSEMKAKNFIVTEEEMNEYLARDVMYTFLLYKLWESKMGKFYYDLLMPCYNAKTIVEFGGVNFDRDTCLLMAKNADRKLHKLTTKMRRLAGDNTFNPNSYKQCSILFPKLCAENKHSPIFHIGPMGYDVSKDTGKEVVNYLAEKGIPFFRLMSDYRRLQKLSGTYLTTKHVKRDGRIHTNFKCHGTETGRLSSTTPNIQNVPKFVRRLYIPDTNHKFYICADYAQLELKVAIAIADLRELIEDINRGYDLHTVTANLMYKKGLEKSAYTKEERRNAKEVNFGCLYGAGDDKLCSLLACGVEDARAFRNKYFGRFEEWKSNVEQRVLIDRFVETAYGSRRRFDLITRRNVAEVQRKAVNTIIQGTAAQMAEERFTRLVHQLPTMYSARVTNLVHDSIDCTCGGDGIEERVAAHMKYVMEQPFHFTDMRFSADVEIGKRWK